MPPTIYRERETNLPRLLHTTVAILGYGNQGRAHALNLRDSGTKVTVGVRPGLSFDQARSDGFRPMPIADAVPKGDLVIVALPDETTAQVFESEIAARLRPGQALGFIHGFNIRFGLITPPDGVDVVMVAPKGPGSLVRSTYIEGKGLPALIAVHTDNTGNAKRIALAWAECLGATRAGAIETTFETETDTDLFGEQVVLCGGVEELMEAAFETLVEAGYEPEFAYLECVHELKQIVDIIYSEGLAAMRKRISNTAEYGGITRGPRLVNDAARAEMKGILEEIRNGQFAKEWIAEHKEGMPKLLRKRDAGEDSPLEQAGRAVRKLMQTE